MASLTEVSHQASKGATLLYIPKENLDDIEKSAAEKDRVQRLEAILIHWTRQIKEVTNQDNNAQLNENAGPLAEIEFWRSRCEDLNGIR
jgi:dynein heavy chain